MKQGKRRVGICIYCGRLEKLSRDHVVPRCLFTKPYPLQLITVPACDRCHGEKSRDEDFLRDYLIVDVQGSQSFTAQAIFATGKVQRSLRRNSSDLLRSVLLAARVEPFYTEAGIYLGDFPQAPIDQQRLERIFARMVRGLYFDVRQVRIPDNYQFVLRRCYPQSYNKVREVFRNLKTHGPRVMGEAFGCMYAAAKEDIFVTLWAMWFYNRVVFTVATRSPMCNIPA